MKKANAIFKDIPRNNNQFFVKDLDNKNSLNQFLLSYLLQSLFILLFIEFYYSQRIQCINIQISTNPIFDLVIPTISQDVTKLLSNKNILKRFIKYHKIVLISQPKVFKRIKKKSMAFISENDLVPFQDIKKIFHRRGIASNRAGWYEQQFLKMAYSRICNNDFYLIWDSDTFPVKPLTLFHHTRPYFNMILPTHQDLIYNEKCYKKSMDCIIPGLLKHPLSYVSEHMLIRTKYMRNLLDEIESNSNLTGKTVWEKILNCVETQYLTTVGFSEFTIYGSYSDTRFPNTYIHRNWSNYRTLAGFYEKPENLEKHDFEWLAQDYDAVSFEKWDSYTFHPKKLEFAKKQTFQSLYRPAFFFKRFCNITGLCNENIRVPYSY